MAKAYVFLGQGAQFVGMGKDLYENNPKAIETVPISQPVCPVYQNVDALPHTDPAEIKDNLLKQFTLPVRWTQSVKNMLADGMTDFVECGPGTVMLTTVPCGQTSR